MNLEVVALFLLSVGYLANDIQGIDEELYPDWKESELEDNFVEYVEPEVPVWILEQEEILAAEQEIIIKLNKGVDKVLGFIREAFTPLGQMGIPLPDIAKPFGHSPYSGTFKASKGYFKNAATLERTGNVEIIVKSSTTVSLQVQLGFKVAEAGFEQYDLEVLNLHEKGAIKVSVAENSVTLKLTLIYAPACTFHLDELKFDKLQGIKVDITGLGVFQTMFNELSRWLISNFESTFREIINKQLYEAANNAIINKNICKYFPQ